MKNRFLSGILLGGMIVVCVAATVKYFTDYPQTTNPPSTYAFPLDTLQHGTGQTPYNYITLGAHYNWLISHGLFPATNGTGSTPTFYGTSTFNGSGGAFVLGTGTIAYGNGAGLTNVPGGSQVWTNYNGGTFTLVPVGTYDEIGIAVSNSTVGVTLGWDSYSYINKDPSISSVIDLPVDQAPGLTPGDGVLLDPMSDNGYEPFRLSSGYSNIVATGANLLSIQNGHTNKFTVTGGGQIILAGTTNHITFGSTNTAPQTPGTIVKWISVQVQGEANAYRLPLYK